MDHRAHLLVLCLLILTAACNPAPPAPAAAEADSVVARIARFESDLLAPVIIHGEARAPRSLAARMAKLRVPAVSIAVIDDGEIDWARAYGLADVESSRPATPETLFQAASISKPVAAMAALDMVEDGLLGLDDNVNAKLTSWQVPDNEHTAEAKVTLRRLLSHTAGTTVWGFPGYARSAELPSAVGVLDGAGNTDAVRVYKAPGESWQYSGGGYTILQVLLTDQSGESFAELMRRRILEPLGMRHSTYEQLLPEARHGDAASAYRGDGSKVEEGWHVYAAQAAAGLWTTPSDLARYAIDILRSHAGEAETVLSPAMAREMLTPGQNDHGLGPGLGAGARSFGHGGANEGFRCRLTAFFAGQTGAVVMTNSDNASLLVNEVMLTLAREYGWPDHQPDEKTVVKLSAEQYAALAGHYHIESGPVDFEIEHVDLKLIVHVPGQPSSEILPESETLFFSRENGQSFEFKIEDGQVRGFHVGGGQFYAQRLEVPAAE